MPGVPFSFGVEHWVRWSGHTYAETLCQAPGRRVPKRRPEPDQPGATAAPKPARAAACLVCAVAVVLALVAAAGSLRFFGLREPEPFARQAALSLFVSQPLRYDLWYQTDALRLDRTAASPLRPAVRARLWREVTALKRELASLDQDGAYTDPRGFKVYAPAVTGKLQALGLARQNRVQLLAGLGRRAIARPAEVFRMAGYQVYRTLPRKFAGQDEVVRALQGVQVPDAALAGYRVYLLPGSLGDMSGAGGHGYTLLGGEPLTVRLVDGQYASTATHELAHHLSLSRLGGHFTEAPREWGRYLKLRGIPNWQDDGAVNSTAWSLSPEEALAEDFRVLFGTEEAAALPYSAGYDDPRQDPALRRRVTQFLNSLANLPERSTADRSATPWLDDLGSGVAEATSPSPLTVWLTALSPRQVLLAVLLLLAVIGLVPVVWLTRGSAPVGAASRRAPRPTSS